MKLRTDFVSNSSSTSFLVIRKGEFTESTFLDLLGVSEDSPLADLGRGVFRAVQGAMLPLQEHLNRYVRPRRAARDWLEETFSEVVADRVSAAQVGGLKVFVGTLSSDHSEFESFFCGECFEDESNDLYVNALNCVW
jgi:hypothetical protein